ncbi:hypothetical protein [Allofournierella sp.]|uniref:hypothetical protein n=1 Tax=Allofournierella sp. TaxID=1940256 RepID=UPI003AB4A18E
MKKALALVLALAMMCALAAPVMAADSDNKTVTNEDGQEVWLNGETKKDAALISVVMPTAINFQIATKEDGGVLTLDDSDPGTGGVVSGTGKFTNNSNRSVKLTLSEVGDAAVTPTVGFLSVLDVYLAPASLTRADVFEATDKDYKLSVGSGLNRELGTMGLSGTLEFKIFAKDNETDTTSLADGKYQLRTVMKVSTVIA